MVKKLTVGTYHGACGRIACEKHTPVPGSDTWRRDRWRKMTPAAVVHFAAATGVKVLCETCRDNMPK